MSALSPADPGRLAATSRISPVFPEVSAEEP
jgi:hypothetical protein